MVFQKGAKPRHSTTKGKTAPAVQAQPAQEAPVHVPPVVIRKELHTDTMEVGQRPDIIIPVHEEISRDDLEAAITGIEAVTHDGYVEALAFNEEPITIRLEPSNTDNPATHEFYAVNGKGIEVWSESNKRWESVGYVPVAREFITKRKYVEVIARARPEKVRTEIDGDTSRGQEVVNRIRRTAYQRNSFSVLHDPNPKGRDWLRGIMAEAL